MCVQGDMAEALKAIDNGLAAAEPELRACVSEADNLMHLPARSGLTTAAASNQPSSAAVRDVDSESGNPGRSEAGVRTEQQAGNLPQMPCSSDQGHDDRLHLGSQAFTACLQNFLVRHAALPQTLWFSGFIWF